MAMSVDGLVSGLNTTEMINQLMQVEALPQTELKNKVTAANTAVTAYQGVNTKLAALTTAAKALGASDAWTSTKASSTSDKVIPTATSSATPGSVTFTVDKLTQTHTVTYNEQSVPSLTDDLAAPVIVGAAVMVILTDGTQTQVNPSNRSLQAVVNAINATPDAAYKASAVQLSPGNYALQLTAVSSGAAGVFDENDLLTTGIDLGTPNVTAQGQDAQITIGSGAGAYSMKSTTNTFTDVMPGVSAAVTGVPTGPVTITTVGDTDSIVTKVKNLVDTANAALSQIRTATAAKNGNTPGGALAGDPTLRSLSQEILSAVGSGAGNNTTLATVGITLDRDGNIDFDADKFKDAYDADPTGTQAYFDSYTEVPHANAHSTAFDAGWDTANGIARKLETLGLRATEGIVLPTDPTATKEGLVTGLIKRRNESITSLNEQVDAWDTRLTSRRAALQRQYSALEVALGKLKDQQSWLTGQLASLS
jgi:flagellar hook-associated protein 2